MRRRICRFLCLCSLALVFVFGMIDLSALAGQGAVEFRTLGAHWLSLHEPSLQGMHAALNANGPSILWGGILLPVLSQPAIFVFGCFAVLFLALAMMFPRRDRRRF